MPKEYTLPEILDAHAATIAEHLHTAMPGRVVKYYATGEHKGTADIQPTVALALRTLDGDVTHEVLPVLPNVPIQWPQGAGLFITFPLEPGDPVGLVFSEVATGEYLDSGDDSKPADARRHSLGYPSAIPGMFAPASTLPVDIQPDALVIGKDGAEGQLVIKGTEIKLGKTAADYVALATLVQTALDAIRTQHNTHFHLAPAGGGNTGVPSSLMTALGPVAATITKAK